MSEGTNNKRIFIIAGAAVAALAAVCVCVGIGVYIFVIADDEDVLEQLDGLETTGGGSLDIGDTGTGRIDSVNEADNWTFEGDAGQRVEIRAFGEDGSDPRIRLFNSDDIQLAEDDDGGDGFDSLLVAALPADGKYTIRLNLFTPGPYTITVGRTDEVVPPNGGGSGSDPGLPVAGGGTISIGGSANGRLDDIDEAHNWTFDGQAGQAVEIRALGEDGSDPRIRLFNPDDVLLAEDDDGGAGLDSLLVVALPADGQYVIQVDVFSPGPYTITLNLTDEIVPPGGVDTDPSMPVTGGGTLSVGSSANGRLESLFEFHDWTFEGGQGQLVTVRVDGDGNSDPRFILIGPDGNTIVDDDDSGGGLNATATATLTSSGTYTIRIDMFTGGPYTVSVE